jgi:uncharacterized protein
MGFLVAAISLGLLGSMHCIGMCGPLALALPIHQKQTAAKVYSLLAYNIGRALTYSLFGVVFGLIGQGFAVFGMQQIISITIGSLILISILLPRLFSFESAFFYSKLNYLKSLIAKYFKRSGISSFFIVGLLNGLLPCGLVYMAIAGAIATGNVLNGALFMAFFGLGTIPAMFSLMWFGDLISIKGRMIIRKAFPYMISVIGIMMILRGLNLGIPYLSPKMEKDKTEVSCHTRTIKCCHKK